MGELYQHREKLWQSSAIEKLVTRSRLDQKATDLLLDKTTMVIVDGINSYALALLQKDTRPHVWLPKEAVMPNLGNTEQEMALDLVTSTAQ
ncbi:hypothetical protein VZT92_016944 [Zoarces viviparus]|uniref:Uncharacterized protein n=1 Tax=Zoarces viviparus TaxID=48416 RepID=A0AAW1EQA4_ZOAVI